MILMSFLFIFGREVTAERSRRGEGKGENGARLGDTKCLGKR